LPGVERNAALVPKGAEMAEIIGILVLFAMK
jgi:hypothetical protein